MPAKAPRKYRLLFYEYMLNRWWPLTFTLALILYIVVGIFWGAEWYFSGVPQPNPLPVLSIVMGAGMLIIASASLAITFALLIMRRMAYVQVFPGYLLLATPLWRQKFSFKRIKTVRSAEFGALFSPSKLSSYQKDLLEDLVMHTVSIVDFSSYPVSRAAMKLFLSSYFFYDNTPHIILLIDDWLKFNTELESARTAGRMSAIKKDQPQPYIYNSRQMREPEPAPKPTPAKKKSGGLLDQLNKK